jgi:hypothetical protein
MPCPKLPVLEQTSCDRPDSSDHEELSVAGLEGADATERLDLCHHLAAEALTQGGRLELRGIPKRRSRASALTVRTGNDHHIAVRIAEPDLFVLGRGVDVRLLDDLRAEVARPLHRGIEVVDLEPQEDTVSRPARVCIGEIGMLFLVPGVELQNQLARAGDPIVYITMAMVRKRVRSKQLAVPAAAGPHVAHCDEGLCLDL